MPANAAVLAVPVRVTAVVKFEKGLPEVKAHHMMAMLPPP